MGSGAITKFWLARWMGDECLALKYPRLFLTSSQQNANINQVSLVVDNVWKWNLQWRRQDFEWDGLQLRQLLDELNAQNILGVGCDKWLWLADPSGQFTVKSAYEAVYSSRFVSQPEEVFIEMWKLKVLKKVQCFG